MVVPNEMNGKYFHVSYISLGNVFIPLMNNLFTHGN